MNGRIQNSKYSRKMRQNIFCVPAWASPNEGNEEKIKRTGTSNNEWPYNSISDILKDFFSGKQSHELTTNNDKDKEGSTKHLAVYNDCYQVDFRDAFIQLRGRQWRMLEVSRITFCKRISLCPSHVPFLRKIVYSRLAWNDSEKNHNIYVDERLFTIQSTLF